MVLRPRVVCFIVAVASVGAVASSACSSDGEGSAGGADPTAGVEAGPGANAGSGGGAGSGGAGGGGTAGGGCERFRFVVSGGSCAAGCRFSCDCPGAFPRSIASCTADGCIVGADCVEVCKGDLGDALACTRTHATTSPRDAGSDADAAPTGLPVGARCTKREDCQSLRCGTASSLCTDGLTGDACNAPSDCQSNLCSSQRCAAWEANRRRFLQGLGSPRILAIAPAGDVTFGGAAEPPVDFGFGAVDAGVFSPIVGTLTPSSSVSGTLTFNGMFAALGGGGLDSTGALLFAGSGHGVTDFGVGAKVADIFVARYAANRVKTWSKVFATDQEDYASAYVVAPSGESYLAGSGRYGSFGASAPDSGANFNAFLARLNADGSLGWMKTFAGKDGSSGLQGTSAALAKNGDVVFAGTAYGLGDVSLGGAVLFKGAGWWIARYTRDGTHVWSKGFAGRGDGILRVTVASDDSLVALFSSFGYTKLDLGGGVLPNAVQSYVAKLDAAGKFVWGLPFVNLYQEPGQAVAILPSGKVVVGGAFRDRADLGTGRVRTSEPEDAFVALLAADGRLEKVHFFGEGGRIGSIAPTPSGRIGVLSELSKARLDGGAFGRGAEYIELTP